MATKVTQNIPLPDISAFFTEEKQHVAALLDFLRHSQGYRDGWLLRISAGTLEPLQYTTLPEWPDRFYSALRTRLDALPSTAASVANTAISSYSGCSFVLSDAGSDLLVFPLFSWNERWDVLLLSPTTTHASKAMSTDHSLEFIVDLFRSAWLQRQQLRILTNSYQFSLDIFDSINSIGLVIDASGCILNMNRAAVAFTGQSLDAIKNQPFAWEQWIPAEERRDIRAFFSELPAHNFNFRHQNHWINPQGDWHLFDWYNAVFNEGPQPYLVALGTDITEQKQLKQSLIQEKDRFRNFLYHASDGVHILDTRQRLLEFSLQFSSMLGYESQELQGQSADLWITEPLSCAEAATVLDYNQPPQRFSTWFRRKNEARIPVEVTQVPMQLDGDTVFFSRHAIFHDGMRQNCPWSRASVMRNSKPALITCWLASANCYPVAILNRIYCKKCVI